MENKFKSKSQPITKLMVWEAYQKVRTGGKSAGVDGLSMGAYEEDLAGNLYKLWNRMTSGSYHPPAVRQHGIPKAGGKKRMLGIPTVGDRVAQMVVKNYLEPQLDPIFHNNSFGYRPGRSAKEAVGQARRNCWKMNWVVDLDIKGFFDCINHDQMMSLLKMHTQEKWVLMYVERWLKAPLQTESGKEEQRNRGTPQGGVISPLLANLYLHHAFDEWMRATFPALPFERYADDVIVHCLTEKQARYVLGQIRERMRKFDLELHPEKTCIVYCKDNHRKEDYEKVSFDFLGYTFKPRQCRNSQGKIFTGFNPAMSRKAKKRFQERMRHLRIGRRTDRNLDEIATLLNPITRGVGNYFKHFHRSEVTGLFQRINHRIVKWTCKKYRKSPRQAWKWLRAIHKRDPGLFAHWEYCYL